MPEGPYRQRHLVSALIPFFWLALQPRLQVPRREGSHQSGLGGFQYDAGVYPSGNQTQRATPSTRKMPASFLGSFDESG